MVFDIDVQKYQNNKPLSIHRSDSQNVFRESDEIIDLLTASLADDKKTNNKKTPSNGRCYSMLVYELIGHW